MKADSFRTVCSEVDPESRSFRRHDAARSHVRPRSQAVAADRPSRPSDTLAARLTEILDSLLADCHLEIKHESVAFGLTASQYHALQAIGDDLLPMQQLARKMLVSASTATRVVQQLVDKQLVVRNLDEKDRRTIRVHLSRKGLRQFRRVRSIRVVNAEEILASIESGEHEALIRSLSLLEAASRRCHEAKLAPSGGSDRAAA